MWRRNTVRTRDFHRADLSLPQAARTTGSNQAGVDTIRWLPTASTRLGRVSGLRWREPLSCKVPNQAVPNRRIDPVARAAIAQARRGSLQGNAASGASRKSRLSDSVSRSALPTPDRRPSRFQADALYSRWELGPVRVKVHSRMHSTIAGTLSAVGSALQVHDYTLGITAGQPFTKPGSHPFASVRFPVDLLCLRKQRLAGWVVDHTIQQDHSLCHLQ